MSKITKKKLLDLGFEEHLPNCFNYTTDLGELDFYLMYGRIEFGSCSNTVDTFEQIKRIKEKYDDLLYGIIYLEND